MKIIYQIFFFYVLSKMAALTLCDMFSDYVCQKSGKLFEAEAHLNNIERFSS
jgi:hypothetical protein